MKQMNIKEFFVEKCSKCANISEDKCEIRRNIRNELQCIYYTKEKQNGEENGDRL